MADASAGDAIAIIFAALSREEQEEVFERLVEARARRDAVGESQMARCLRSLQLVAEHVGHVPSVDEYKQASSELIAEGHDVETFARLYRHFDKSWRRVREALALSETTTARRIEARFRYRKVGKVWRFTDDTLGESLARCVEHYGHVPMVAEYTWWRDRELELARAAGNDALHIPSPNPYRRRWKTWEAALLHFGYTPDQVAERLERP